MSRYYAVEESPEFLAHYGILGMHWGVRRTSEELGHMKIPNNASFKNLNKFGKDPQHNVCYIMGGSGSGKSTVARNNRKNANVIHLDAYIDGRGAPKSKEFNSFLLKNGLHPDDIPNGLRKDPRNPKVWAKVDDFSDLIDKFGAQQYLKKKRVIVEGVQLMDDTMRPDKSYFKNKPYIVLNTSSIVSTLRANRRDSKPFSFSDIQAALKRRKLVNSLKQKLGIL